MDATPPSKLASDAPPKRAPGRIRRQTVAPMPASSSPAASRAPRQDNRRVQLLDAAARLFRERGFHATSMRDIAKAVGMLSGSIYYHFNSKEEMLLAVYEEG